MDLESFPGLPDWDLQPPKTEFDYSRWKPTGKLHICNCTWGTSEVQVGNRSLIGQGAVVDFGGKSQRDAWFDENAQGIALDIMYRGFDQTEYIVPLPWDVVCEYNYLWIEYQPATSADALIDHETAGTKRVFFFIRGIKSDDSAPNTTRVTVLPDYWTTFRYDVKFTGLLLKRGHYAVANSADVDTYLASPATSTAWLTAPDVQPSQDHLGSIALRQTFNGTEDGKVYAVTIWTCSTVEEFTAGDSLHSLQPNTWIERGGSGYNIAALTLTQLEDLFDKISRDSDYAALATCFKGMFFVGSDYITIGNEYDMFGWSSVKAWHVGHIQAPILSDKLQLAKSMFNYPDRYAAYTKLYTTPYAYVTITTNQDAGHAAQAWDVSTQAITYLQVCTNLVFSAPSFGSTHKILGINTKDARQSDKIPMRTVDNNQSTNYYDANSNAYEWHSEFVLHFGMWRAKQVYEAVNANARAAELQNINRTCSGDKIDNDTTSITLSDVSLDYAANWVPLQNQRTANAALVANNAAAYTAELATNSDLDVKMGADAKNDNKYTAVSCAITNDNLAAVTSISNDANSQSTSVGATATTNIATMQGVATGINGVINGACSIVGGLASATSGGPGAAISGVASGVSSIATGVVSGVTTGLVAGQQADAMIQQTNIANQAAHSTSIATIAKNDDLKDLSIEINDDKTQYAMGFADAQITNTNTCRVTSTSNSNDAALTQAKRAKNVNDAQTKQKYKVTKALFDARVDDYDLNNGCMLTIGGQGNDYMALTGNDNVTISVNTLPDGEIARIGDQFALYGYTAESWINDSDGINLNVMPTFSYWECEKVHAVYNMPDEFADRLKILLMGGITVYSDPEQVNNGVIYQ